MAPAHDGHRHFIPAAGHDLLLPLYDPLLALLGADGPKLELIEQAGITPGMRVLDIGCGTGTVVVEIARRHDAHVVGLDPDQRALARAQRKADRAGIYLKLDQGYSDELPYPDAAFDRVLSSFMFHHLDAEVKAKTLREVRRVLAPGGELHLLDFGGSAPRSEGLLARFIHSAEDLQENFGGGIAKALGEAGFPEVTETATRRTLFGRIASYRASG